MKVAEQDYLMHVGRSIKDGAPVGSGRYPLGSGENPYQSYKDFQARKAQLRRQGLKEKEIADYFGMTIREFRKEGSRASAEIDRQDYATAKKLREDRQWSYAAIGKELGRSATGVEKLLKRDAEAKSRAINNTAEMLKESLDTRGGFIDVGAGSELYIGVSKSKLEAAVKQLHDEGYAVFNMPVTQLFGKGNTNIQLVAPPGTTKGDVWNALDQIRLPIDIAVDNATGEKKRLRPIENVSSDRIQIKYAEEGGIDKDGVIELRRGVKDLDLGNARYAQVRIGVDGTHYLKGMAVYADDLPDGIDIRFNTNKHVGTDKMKVLKEMPDPTNKLNPFGAAIKAGGQHGALNIVNEEGNWRDWSKTLSAQFLSKQLPSLAKKQLKLTGDNAEAELESIKMITNPTIKRYYLEQFANSCEADAMHLKAASLPRQAPKVLLPVPELKENEIYAPTYRDGEQLALVRYPHGGTFEIPVLTVNNNGKGAKAAKKFMDNAQDAVGIHPSAAATLSGADFDGDTVMVIPMSSAKIQYRAPGHNWSKALDSLKGFDPKERYNGSHLSEKDLMKKGSVQKQMGMVSNLITDMTVQNAPDADLVKAVKHSMVVIDAYKHKLDYKQSEKDNDIAALKARYQPKKEDGTGGASTLLSRAKRKVYGIPERRIKAVSKLTPDELKRYKEGEIIYEPTGKKSYRGTIITISSREMKEVSDAYELSSGSVIEKHYADYANRMKTLAKEARKELRSTPLLEYSSSANKTYHEEVESLKGKLNTALMNAPRERKAQALANSTWRVEEAEHPEYDKEHAKKAKSRHLEAARAATGAGKENINISDREWEAIQAGAVHDSTLLKILNNSDADGLRARAMPRSNSIGTAKIARAKSMLNSGYSWQEIADALGVSVSGLQKAIN